MGFIEAKEDELILECLESLAKIFDNVSEEYVSPVLVNLCLRLKPALENVCLSLSFSLSLFLSLSLSALSFVCLMLRDCCSLPTQETEKVRANAFTLFGTLSNFGKGSDAFMEQLHACLPSLLVHSNDESRDVRGVE